MQNDTRITTRIVSEHRLPTKLINHWIYSFIRPTVRPNTFSIFQLGIVDRYDTDKFISNNSRLKIVRGTEI